MLTDAVNPYLQRPRLTDTGSQETRLAPGFHPIKKLNPTSPPEQAIDFWQMSWTTPDALPAPQAVMGLVVYHHFSLAGNNSYGGQKCSMGAPGIRYPGKDNTATEVGWLGDTLLATLAMNTPRSWTQGSGLPAWADRECALSRVGLGEHPLWRATWSSNVATGLWENNHLVAVRVGGIPEEWHVPSMGTSKESRKAWFDQRNIEDPLYLYANNARGELKAQRVDIGRDATDMAVQWNALGNPRKLRSNSTDRLWGAGEASRVLFLRHRVEGTASSASIRASEAMADDTTRWAPTEVMAEDLQQYSEIIQKLHDAVVRPFRRKTANDKTREEAGKPVYAIEALSARRPDVSTQFWRNMGPVFDSLVGVLAVGGMPDGALWQRAREASITAFDLVVEPYYAINPPVVEFVRNHVRHNLAAALREAWFNEDGIDD